MYKSFIGRRFGRLVVQREASEKVVVAHDDGTILEKTERACYCHCDCDKDEVLRKEHRVLRSNLAAVMPNTTSCGCYAKERRRKRMSKHGDPDATNIKVRTLRKSGFSCRQIGTKVGLSGQRVHQILTEKRC